MIYNNRVYHAGDFKNKYGTLNVGLSGTSFCSGYFFTTTKEACENQGAGFNLEHRRPVYSFDISGLNLFPITWQDCKTLNLFNKCLYYWPVYKTYGLEGGDIDVGIYYKPVYDALMGCFEDFYTDDVPEDERVGKFLRELKDSYQIEADDMAEIGGEYYSFQDFVQDNRSLRKLADKLRPIEPDAHNTFPVLSKLMIEGDVDILKNKMTESEDHLLVNILGNISADMLNYSDGHYNDSPDKCAWLEGQATQLFDIAEKILTAGYGHDLIVKVEEIERNIEEGSGSNDDIFDFARDISQVLKDFKDGKKGLYESIKLKEGGLQYVYEDLRNELENFLDKYELATNIDSMLQKVADLVGIDKKQLIKIADGIYSKYADLYDNVTRRFDNWSAPKDDLFTTQLLKQLGYSGTYPIDDRCDSTEWGGTIFNIESIKAIQPENDIAKQLLGENIRRFKKF